MAWFKKSKQLKTYILAEKHLSGFIDSVPGPKTYIATLDHNAIAELREKTGDALHVMEGFNYITVGAGNKDYIPIFISRLLAEIFRQGNNASQGNHSEIIVSQPGVIRSPVVHDNKPPTFESKSPSALAVFVGIAASQDKMCLFVDEQMPSLSGCLPLSEAETDEYVQTGDLPHTMIKQLEATFGKAMFTKYPQWDGLSQAELEDLAQQEMMALKQHRRIRDSRDHMAHIVVY